MIKLMHGDCLELMKEIPDNSIDMVLTDPPYGTTACKWDTIIPFNYHVESNGKLYEQEEFFKKFGTTIETVRFWEDERRDGMWQHLKRITKDNGAICLFGAEPFSSALRMSNIKDYKYDWVWNKVNKFTGHLNAKRMPMTDHELISIFYKKQSCYRPQKREGSYKTRMTGKGSTSETYGKHVLNNDSGRQVEGLTPKRILDFKAQNTGKKYHVSQKPVALLEYLVNTYTLESETIIDFAMGSASTGIACKKLNRKFIGIELDAKCFAVAEKRMLGEL